MDQPKEESHQEPGQEGGGGGGGDAPSKFAPSTYGNAAGDKIQSTLGVVGGPVGKGLETVTKPVGGVVDSIVGGLTRAGEMTTSETGMGKEGDKAAKEDEAFSKEVGGKEQTGGNPLGL